MADQDPWEINYARPAGSGPTTGYTVKGLEGTEPKIELRPVGQRAPASTNTQTLTVDPWEVTYEKPKTPDQPSPVERAGKAFYEGSGLSALVDLASGDDERVKRVLTGTAQGIAAEPARIWNEIKQSFQTAAAGDPSASAYHLAGAVPFFGAPAQQIAQDVARGDYASAVGHTGGLVAPMLIGPAGRAGAAGATFVKGAVPGALKAVVETQPLTVRGFTLPVPTTIASAAGGGQAAAMMGLPRSVGTAAGAVVPIVRGGIRGGRAALSARAAAAAEQLAAENAVREAADAALARQAQVYEAHEAMTQSPGQLQLGPGPARTFQMPPITEEPPVPAPVNVPLRRTPAGQLPPASSYQMPPAGTAAEEARIQRLQPETVTPEAAPTPAAAPAVTMETLAPALTDGKPLSKLTKTERAQVQAVYDRIQHPLEVSEPTAAERAIITPASEATATLEYNAPQAQPEPPPPRGKTAAEMLEEEIAAKRAAAARVELPAQVAKETPVKAQAALEKARQVPAPEPAAPPEPAAGETFSTAAVEKLIRRESKQLRAEGDYIETPNPSYGVSQPDGSILRVKQLRTPKGTLVFHSTDGETWRIVNDPRPGLEESRQIRSGMAPAETQTLPPAAPAAPPAPQHLSDLMVGELPKIEQPGRSMYTETGELKSARQRGQEIKLANIEAKAQRFSDALTAFGMDPADVAKVKEGWVTAEAMKAGSPPGWENVMHDLIAKGLLDKAERKAPSESVPRIVELMQQKQIAKPATAPAPQNLSELMKPPKPAAGVKTSGRPQEPKASMEVMDAIDESRATPRPPATYEPRIPAHVAEEIKNLISDSDYSAHGLRIVTDPQMLDRRLQRKVKVLRVGDIAPPSWEWKDGTPTKRRLPGTSAIKLDDYDVAYTPEELARRVEKGLKQTEGYRGSQLVLLGTKKEMWAGNDVGEIVMEQPVVLGSWQLGSPKGGAPQNLSELMKPPKPARKPRRTPPER